MKRRSFLSAAAVGLAGCTAGADRTPAPGPAATDTETLPRRGDPPTVCERDVVDVGITAIVDPAFGDAWFDDDRVVVGIEREGRARAYPLSVLSQVEVVNELFPVESDDGPGRPLLVTYCPVCNSGMVAERRVRGEPTLFGVSGHVWALPDELTRQSERDDRVFAVDRDDAGEDLRVDNYGALVMYDAATGSYWSQILARAICGPQRGRGLTVVPARTVRWDEWRRDHPDTEVLLPYPDSAVENPPLPGQGSAPDDSSRDRTTQVE